MSGSWQMDIAVPRSGAKQFTLLARDVNGDPVNLTGIDAAMEFREQSGDASTIAVAGIETCRDVTGVVLTDADNGQVLVSIYGSIFGAVEGQYEVVRLSHKIRFTKAGESPLLIYGQINLLPE